MNFLFCYYAVEFIKNIVDLFAIAFTIIRCNKINYFLLTQSRINIVFVLNFNNGAFGSSVKKNLFIVRKRK